MCAGEHAYNYKKNSIMVISPLLLFLGGELGKDSCKGDSGGGLYIQVRNSFSVLSEKVGTMRQNTCVEQFFHVLEYTQ